MSVQARNVAVGLTVIMGLVLLAALVMVFTGRPSWSQSGYDIRVTLDDAGGLRNGSVVQLNGMEIGKVIGVDFRDGDASRGLMAVARIDMDRRIPASVRAEATPPAMGMGSSVLRLILLPTERGTEQYLPTDGTAVITGRAGGLMLQMETLAGNLEQLVLAVNTGASPDGSPLPADSPIALVTVSLHKVNLALDAALTLMDAENQQNVKVTLANARELSTSALAAMDDVKALLASGQSLLDSGQGLLTQAGEAITEVTRATTRASTDLDRLTQNLIDNTEQLSRTMATLNTALAKLEQGEGTAGKLLNDPRLYGNLVDITDQMTHVMNDLQVLVQEWKDRGVGIRLR